MLITLINIWPYFIGSKGGMEKIFCEMANALSRRGHHITAIYCDKKVGPPPYPIDKEVQFINADFLTKTPFTLLPFMRNIRALDTNRAKRRKKRTILKAHLNQHKLQAAISNLPTDIFISFQPETTYNLMKIRGETVPIVTMFHGPVDVYQEMKFFKEDIERSAAIQVLRPEFVKDALRIMPSARVEVIPNIVPQFRTTPDLSAPTIINIARISQGKLQHLLVEAFAIIKDSFPSWNLELWGGMDYDKKYTHKVKDIIREQKLENRVFLRGATDNVYDHLAKASIFAFPSEYEGFGLALTEAMSMGLPPIGLKTCPSVNTLIRDGENGILCANTPNSLADALSRLMSDRNLRIKFGTQAKKDMEKYAPKYVWDKWESLLYSITDPKP